MSRCAGGPAHWWAARTRGPGGSIVYHSDLLGTHVGVGVPSPKAIRSIFKTLSKEYEPPLGPGKRPDYLVHTKEGDILCEVKDFGEAAIDRKIQDELQPVRLPDGTMIEGGIAVGSWDP